MEWNEVHMQEKAKTHTKIKQQQQPKFSLEWFHQDRYETSKWLYSAMH